jgi:hypothetical protein
MCLLLRVFVKSQPVLGVYLIYFYAWVSYFAPGGEMRLMPSKNIFQLLTIVYLRSKYEAQLTKYCPIVTIVNKIIQTSTMPILRTYR